MEQLELFDKLEKKIESLLDGYKHFKDDKSRLEAALIDKDDKIKELNGTIESLKTEKNTIHARITKLVETIEEWQKTKTENT